MARAGGLAASAIAGSPYAGDPRCGLALRRTAFPRRPGRSPRQVEERGRGRGGRPPSAIAASSRIRWFRATASGAIRRGPPESLGKSGAGESGVGVGDAIAALTITGHSTD